MGTEIMETEPVALELPQNCSRWSSEEAEKRKTEGNEMYKLKKYREALEMYSEAIRLQPANAAYYGNRAATYMMLSKFDDALDDARHSVVLDNQFVKGYQREAKCLLSLGNSYAALQSYKKVLELEPGNKAVMTEVHFAEQVHKFEEEARKDYEKGDYRRAVFCMNQCLQHAPSATKYQLRKAECLALLGQYQEAQEIANSIVAMDNTNIDAIFVRGLCLYYEDHIDKAQQHFREVLRLYPDHVKAKDTFRKTKVLISKKEEGNTAFKAGKYAEAFDLYTDALKVDPVNKSVNAKLYCNRATVCAKIHKMEEGAADCTSALDADPHYLKAYLRRAKFYMDMGKYDEAVRDYESAYTKDNSRDTKQLLQEAKLELKKSKRKDYYKILGVSKDAGDDEIKKAYKKRALIHHPDRHSHDTPEKQREEELKFKELGEAYTVLSDPKKKARFDSGQDLEEMGGPGGGDIDPNSIFQMFFGGGGGGMEDFGGFYGGGMPGRGQHRHGARRGCHNPSPGFSFQF